MASSIGGIAFISIEGLPDLPGQQVEPTPSPYTSGNAYRQTAIRGNEVELVAYRDCTDLTDAGTIETSCKAIQGTVTDIIKDGITYSDYVIILVTTLQKQKGSVACGGVTPHGNTMLKLSFLVACGASP